MVACYASNIVIEIGRVCTTITAEVGIGENVVFENSTATDELRPRPETLQTEEGLNHADP